MVNPVNQVWKSLNTVTPNRLSNGKKPRINSISISANTVTNGHTFRSL